MLKRHSDFFKSLMLINDLLLVSLGVVGGLFDPLPHFLFRSARRLSFPSLCGGMAYHPGVWAAVFAGLDLYRPRRISSRVREITDLIKGSSLA